MKGGVGAKPPARGSTPVPRPRPSDYRYKSSVEGSVLNSVWWFNPHLILQVGD
jgi:hypothetical protein